MSLRTDIIDGAAAAKARRGLIYTCKCGWIDLGHARPDGALELWNKIKTETGERSKDHTGYKLTHRESMTGFHLTVGEEKTYYVKYRLSPTNKESVAFSIFMEVSMKFEQMQNSFPYSVTTDSGYSAEDLVSNVIGFYRAVRPGDYITPLRPVSLAAALRVWDTYGAVGKKKNYTANPYLYPCSECSDSPAKPVCKTLPADLCAIKPAPKNGVWYRDWP